MAAANIAGSTIAEGSRNCIYTAWKSILYPSDICMLFLDAHTHIRYAFVLHFLFLHYQQCGVMMLEMPLRGAGFDSHLFHCRSESWHIVHIYVLVLVINLLGAKGQSCCLGSTYSQLPPSLWLSYLFADCLEMHISSATQH